MIENQHMYDAYDALPGPLPDSGTLFLGVPPASAETAWRPLLLRCGLRFHEPYPGVLAVPLGPGRLGSVCAELPRYLTNSQLRQCKCRLFPDGGHISPGDLMHSEGLDQFVARVQANWLIDLLRDNRLTTYFQPVVYTADPQEVFAHECLVRGKRTDGRLVYPDQLFDAARAVGLLCYLDGMARLAAIETVRQLNLSTQIFINFNPSSLGESLESLERTVAAAEASGMPPDQFVFEVVESEEIRDVDRLLEILEYYRVAGFRVALDDLGAGYSSLNLLTRLKPDFIKLDMGLIRNVDTDPYKGQVAGKLLELAKELHIGTVVEGVESVGEWHWAADHGADYAQGYLFARPDAVPPRPAANLPRLVRS